MNITLNDLCGIHFCHAILNLNTQVFFMITRHFTLGKSFLISQVPKINLYHSADVSMALKPNTVGDKDVSKF